MLPPSPFDGFPSSRCPVSVPYDFDRWISRGVEHTEKEKKREIVPPPPAPSSKKKKKKTRPLFSVCTASPARSSAATRPPSWPLVVISQPGPAAASPFCIKARTLYVCACSPVLPTEWLAVFLPRPRETTGDVACCCCCC
jgi:hypothetical protein